MKFNFKDDSDEVLTLLSVLGMRLDLERGVSWRVLCVGVCVAFLQSQQWRTGCLLFQEEMVKEAVLPAALVSKRQWYWHCLFLWWEWPSFLYLHENFDYILQGAKLMLKCFLDWPSPTTLCPTPWAGQQVASSIFQWDFILLILAYLTLYYNPFVVVVDSVTA